MPEFVDIRSPEACRNAISDPNFAKRAEARRAIADGEGNEYADLSLPAMVQVVVTVCVTAAVASMRLILLHCVDVAALRHEGVP
jgi:hypothetical protein